MAASGVTFLDHTADVGIDVHADSAAQLFHRAALGMLDLLHGSEDEPTGPSTSNGGDASISTSTSISISISGEGWAGLLHAWLHEVLVLHETRHRDYADADFDRLDATGLEAAVRTVPAAAAVREIKGVTYHELAVERTDQGWRGRVIFDV